MKRLKRKIYKRQSDLTKSVVSAVIRRQKANDTKREEMTQKVIGRMRLKMLLGKSRRLEE